MAKVISTHIVLTYECEECGHEFDLEDYDSLSVEAAQVPVSCELCDKL